MNHSLSPESIILVVGLYFLVLILISYFTGKDDSSDTFFRANKKSPWLLVAFGMVGASLSGVTFISIPGVVGGDGHNMNFSYMQMVMGYLVGYVIIGTVLMPLYYRLNLTSIYEYLNLRYGKVAQYTGSFYFILSRLVGASFRLFLVAIIIHQFITSHYGLPFIATVAITIALIWIYTFRGGIKTIVWTDTLQTTFMILAVILTIIGICSQLNLNFGELVGVLGKEGYTKTFYFENGWSDPNNFFKQFVSGALISLVMTGLDQDLMQKNLTCKSIGEAQKNMFVFCIFLVITKLIFLTLGGLLYYYSHQNNIAIPASTDLLYPQLALGHLGPFIGIFFVLGLIAAAYSSADSALTSLTTAFCVDFLSFNTDKKPELHKNKVRRIVHVVFSFILLAIVYQFRSFSDTAVINLIFQAAGYTYGPLLGMFAFGILTRRSVNQVPLLAICLIAPILSYVISSNSTTWFDGFQFGHTIIALNGFLTFLGLFIFSRKEGASHEME